MMCSYDQGHEIPMKSDRYEVVEVGKTKAEFWKDVKKGDVLIFSMTFAKQQTSYRRGYTAPYITISIEDSEEQYCCPFNQAQRAMEKFKIRRA